MKKTLILLLISVLFLCACENKKVEDNTIITSVGNEILYRFDLIKILPAEISSNDSAIFVQNYINEWRFERLFYNEAMKNLDDTTEIAEKIKEYHRQLFVHYYMEQLIGKEIDLKVDSVEIVNYYNTHLNDYFLRSSVVKAHYFVISSNIATYYNVVDKLRQSKLEDVDDLQKYCLGTERQVFFLDKWTDFNDFLVSINYKSNISDNQLTINNIIDIINGDKRYIIKIDNVCLKTSIAPLELLQNDIVRIIINNRKKEKFAEIKNKIINDNVN